MHSDPEMSYGHRRELDRLPATVPTSVREAFESKAKEAAFASKSKDPAKARRLGEEATNMIAEYLN